MISVKNLVTFQERVGSKFLAPRLHSFGVRMNWKYTALFVILFLVVAEAKSPREITTIDTSAQISCEFGQGMNIPQSVESKAFEVALREMVAKPTSNLSLLLPDYEAHLEMINRGEELELRLSGPTRISVRPDSPRIQKEASLWILQQLKSGLSASQLPFKRYSLSLSGIMIKDSLVSDLNRQCPHQLLNEPQPPERNLAYLAALGNSWLKHPSRALSLQITLR